MSALGEAEPELAGAPASVGALRGAYFRGLIRNPAFLALIGFAALLAGLAVGVNTGSVLGVLAAACVLLVGLAIPYFLLRRRAAKDFFAAYARERGLELVEEGLPEVTPLLYAGSSRVTTLAMEGELAASLTGTIAHYTYAEPSGGNAAAAFDLTIVLAEVPESLGVFPKLLCHGRVKSQRTDKLDDTFRGDGTRRLELESEALDRRFEIFFDPRDDEVRLRRLFSPSFMVWLGESMPTAFELVNGHLCCFAAGHLDSAAELDAVVTGAAELARRLRAEATE